MEKQIVEVDELMSKSATQSLTFDVDGTLRLPQKFAALTRMVTRDLNNNPRTPTFYLYTKDQITTFLQNPANNQKALRDAAIYIYGASSHFRRLIQYFTGLTDLAYVVSPHKIDTSKVKPATIGSQYRKTINMLSSMDIKNQFPKIITVCLREDVFYG